MILDGELGVEVLVEALLGALASDDDPAVEDELVDAETDELLEAPDRVAGEVEEDCVVFVVVEDDEALCRCWLCPGSRRIRR